MEALTAVTVACLTVYDMVKAVDREMVIEDVKLVSKTQAACSRLIDRRQLVVTTDRQVRRAARRDRWSACSCEGRCCWLTAVVIGALAGWTERVERRGSSWPRRTPSLVARAVGQPGSDQLERPAGRARRWSSSQLERANAILEQLGQVPDPGRSRGGHLRYRPERRDRSRAGIPAGEGREQLQGATRGARWTRMGTPSSRSPRRGSIEPDVTERDLYDRETNLRIGFRFLKDLLEQFDHDMHARPAWPTTAAPARSPTSWPRAAIPANGYAEAVMEG